MTHLKQSIIKWLLVSIACLLIGFSVGRFKLGVVQGALDTMQVTLQSLSTEKAALSKKIAAVEASQLTDLQTIKRLAEENKDLNEQLDALTNKLYFYERVVAPELQSSGVQVYSFTVDKDSATGLWCYELILMQAKKGRRLLTGTFTLDFSFLENEVLKKASISQFSENPLPKFKFKYFQTIKGGFSLPAEMAIDDVILKLNVPGNRWHKGQQLELHYDWQSLITTEAEQVSEDDEPLPGLKISDTAAH